MFYRGRIKGGIWVEFEAFDSRGRRITEKPENKLVKAQLGKSPGELLDLKV